MPGRQFNGNDYRYGMNGQEKDDEVFQGAMTAQFWEYDSRIGRRWNSDPVFDPNTSPYACFSNSPILLSDPNGDTPHEPKSGKTTVKKEPESYKTDDPKCMTCGGGKGSTSAVINPGGAGSQLNSLPENNSKPVYSKDGPLKDVYGSNNLYSASPSNVSNYYYQISNAEPNRLELIDGMPSVGYSVKVAGIGLNTDGTTTSFPPMYDMPESVSYMNVKVSQNGIGYGDNTIGKSKDVTGKEYYLKQGGVIVEKVTAQQITTKVTLGPLETTNIKLSKTVTTLSTGKSYTTKMVDSTILMGTFGVESGEFSAEVVVPFISKKNN
jgi:hypothetical protein